MPSKETLLQYAKDSLTNTAQDALNIVAPKNPDAIGTVAHDAAKNQGKTLPAHRDRTATFLKTRSPLDHANKPITHAARARESDRSFNKSK